MSQANDAADIEELINDLIALLQAQVADLREYAQATQVGEGTVQLERTIRRREVQRTELYRKFEAVAFHGVSGTNSTA